MQKARRRPKAPTACKQLVSGTISLPCSGYFSPFPHGTCSLSVSYAYVGLEGGSPIFKQFNVLLLMIMKGIIQDFYLLWSMYSNMFFNFINICLVRVLSPILTESRLISFPRGYLDVSVLLVSK